ncbi:MAG: hypothetical protein EA383_11660 [Spirochaetaceae bacterium]|nr:MAG: hypothetical protein EA383_11660 [Spirochaetaceae bacterium]
MKAFRIQGAKHFDDVLYVQHETGNDIQLIRRQRNAWGEFDQPLTLTRAMFDLCLRTGYLTAVDIAPPTGEAERRRTAPARMVV